MTDIELLRGTELFSTLSHEELEGVARCVAERLAEGDEVVIREGEPGESLFLVREGRVGVEKGTGANALKLAELGPGSAFGEMSLIDDVPTSATVRTLEPCSFLVISRLDLNVLLNWDTVLGSKMWRAFTARLSKRLRAANDRLATGGSDAHRHLLAATADVDAR